MRETNWRASAGCRGSDPELFFPIGSGTSFATLAQSDEAKAVCGRCPVARECLEWALNVAVEGVWGGTTETERRAIRRRRA
ncbi:WhiB family transcriptional regulator [Kitasatospora sp. NPDC089913]|uniref:WhiB family transcriptional regulator n=1 Tax=Streptomycetaceae TaxID=2062 RepID=UPI00087AF177|nr:WhiB family transcriptional regulator [Streptomyces sp. TLI_053]SDT82735.1 WhiB family transcriptional regulator, redox-sensing transcriptional regulator [Streptomyces sp. TLI_053]